MLLIHKPTIQFDPTNKKHREVVRLYMETGRLATDEFKFQNDPKYISVGHQIQQKLLAWYLNKELRAVRQSTKVAA